ncbi:MAG TPA: TorF family putative porin [Xanthobacteraceae bacterium]
MRISKLVLAVMAASLGSTAAYPADMAVKAPQAPPPSPWDVAITGAVMSDYNFRGITQSNHQPSVAVGFEPRYNFNKNLQGYVGVSGESIDFPNRAAAEIDFYAGVRPTFDKLVLDFGVWYYYYPNGQCFNAAVLCSSLGGDSSTALSLPNGNVVKADVSFLEFYGKATYTLNDNVAFGGQIWGSPVFRDPGLAGVLDSGAYGIYYTGNLTLTAPTTWFPDGLGAYASADVGWWQLGTSDAFYGVAGFPGGIPYTSYLNWDVGFGFTWKIFTLDLRYYQSNLSKGDCNAFTSDQTASGMATTPINPGLPGSNWCGAAFIAKLSMATTLGAFK